MMTIKDSWRVCLVFAVVTSALALTSALAVAGSQRPILPHRPIEDRVAALVLYPGSRLHPDDLTGLGEKQQPCQEDSELPSTRIDLEIDTCLSGEYYLRDNLKITKVPICKDGSTPTVNFYKQRGCAGEPETQRVGGKLVNDCLLSKEDDPWLSYYWSLVMSCSGMSPDATNYTHWKHKEVTPVIARQVVGGLNGNLAYYTTEPCSDEDGGNTPFTWSRTVDDCAFPRIPRSSWGKFTHIKIQNPPICPNGTRARLARFESTDQTDWEYTQSKCNGGELTFEQGLVDINDQDIGKCITVENMALTRGGTADAKGIMFLCDGVLSNPDKDTDKKNQTQTPHAIVSHNHCKIYPSWNGHEPPRRPTTYIDIPLDTCTNLHDRQPLHLLKTPTCEDGSDPLMATWQTLNCPGMPDRVAGISPSLGLPCKEFHGTDDTASYSFWCDQDKSRRLARPKGDNRAVFSDDTCKAKDGGWSPEQHAGLAPGIKRVEADTCIGSLDAETEWVVHGNAVCDDGKAARMAVWEGNGGCQGKPTVIGEVGEGELGKCVEACGKGDWMYRCSRAFWCEGWV